MCRTRQSRTYLFSGALVCGECGSSMVIVSGSGKRGYVKYGCHSHKHTGACTNKLTIRRDRLEEQLLAAIEQHVLSADMIAYAVQRCKEELGRRLAELHQQAHDLDSLKRQREELRIRQRRVIEAIEQGEPIPALTQRLRELEEQARGIDRAIARPRSARVEIPEAEIRSRVTKALLDLRQAISDEDLERAKMAILKHLGRLILTPVVRQGKPVYRVTGGVSLPDENGGMLLVARDGIEPPTPAFSGPLSAVDGSVHFGGLGWAPVSADVCNPVGELRSQPADRFDSSAIRGLV